MCLRGQREEGVVMAGEDECGGCGLCGDAALLECVLRGQVPGRRAEEVASSLVAEVGLEGLSALGETELSLSLIHI